MGRPERMTNAKRDSSPAAVLHRRQADGQRLTINDVADQAGVSAITVSRALNGGSCSPATRLRIQNLARQLGYEPNAAAQALAASKRKRTLPVRLNHDEAPKPQVWQSYAEMMLRLMRPLA